MHPIKETFSVRHLVEYKGKRARILDVDNGKYDIFILQDRETIQDVDESDLSTLKRCLGMCQREIRELPDGGRDIYCSGCDRVLRSM